MERRRTCPFLAALITSASLFLPGTASGQRVAAPATAPADAVLDLRVSGLRPGRRVTIRATMPDSAGRAWRAEAVFAADRRGQVVPARHVSLGGSYTGVDAMGLVTSMELADQPGAAIYVPPGLTRLPVTFTLVVEGRTADSVTVVRHLQAPGVRAVPVYEGGLVGTLFLPARPGPAPAVLALGGSEGGNSAEDVAAQLAGHGYVTLSLAYFGADSLPPELDEIPLEYFTRAITYLGAQPGVDSTRIALFGTSKGAEAGLLVAAHDPRVRAVVAYAPSSVAWSCICSNASNAAHSSWTLGGVGVPSVPPGRDPSAVVPPGQPQRPAVHYRYRMRSAEAAAAAIPVERINGPVLLVAGDADDLWPSGEMAREVRDRLAAVPGRVGDEVLIYVGAGHRIRKSFLPAGSTLMAGGRLTTGGTPRTNAAAQADAWPRVLRFLSAAVASAGGGA